MNWVDAPPCLLLGHRGARLNAPENTLPALELAVKEGADGVEIDVQLSADGVPLIIHDWTVDRTTNGTGSVATMTAEALHRLDAGDGATIPTLAQVFDHFGAEILYNVELKTLAPEGEALEQAVARLIDQHGVGPQVLVSSFNPRALERMHQIAPGVALGFLHVGPGRLILPEVPLLAVHPHVDQVDAQYLRWSAEHNYRVHVWTVNDAARARALRAQGVRAIISDDPATIRAALAH